MIHFASNAEMANVVGSVDEDGDYVVHINTIPVLYIGRVSGEICMFHLSETEKKELRRLGFSIRYNNLALAGYKPNDGEEYQDEDKNEDENDEAAGF